MTENPGHSREKSCSYKKCSFTAEFLKVKVSWTYKNVWSKYFKSGFDIRTTNNKHRKWQLMLFWLHYEKRKAGTHCNSWKDVCRDTGKHREKFLDKLSLWHENVPVHEYYVLLEITGCEEWLPTGWQST